jgi:hypothetical protein
VSVATCPGGWQIFLVLFLAQLAAIVFVVVEYGVPAVDDETSSTSGNGVHWLLACLALALTAAVFSGIWMGVMIKHAEIIR